MNEKLALCKELIDYVISPASGSHQSKEIASNIIQTLLSTDPNSDKWRYQIEANLKLVESTLIILNKLLVSATNSDRRTKRFESVSDFAAYLELQCSNALQLVQETLNAVKNNSIDRGDQDNVIR